MGREGADARTSGTFYRAVVHAVLLFESETWVMPPRIGRTLVGYHHRVIHRLTGRETRRQVDGSWLYPSLVAAMAEAGSEEMETYVACRQNKIAQFIANILIMDLCMAAERRPGAQVSQR